MRVRLTVLVAALALVAPVAVAAAGSAGPAASARSVSDGGVVASATDRSATLTNGRITREWTIDPPGRVETSSITDAQGIEWVHHSPDFHVDLNSVSRSGWVLSSVAPQRPPAMPGRPTSARGAALLFRYAFGEPALGSVGLELERLFVLHPGTSVIETTSTLLNHSAAAVRVPEYSLDQIVPAYGMPAEILAFNGGSDWRDDYRHATTWTTAFDLEGEVLRFGTNSGIFLASQRRGGAMSRAVRDKSGVSWIGVDWKRDLFDWGPLRTAPPTYNRTRNPVPRVPIRARLLPPLGSLDLGTSYLGVYRGGSAEAGAEFSRNFVGSSMPAFARTVGLNTFHPWSHGPDMSDANLRKQVDIAKSLGIETFMLDDQWQGGPGGESGDWRFDAGRFPDSDGNGRPDFVDYLHANGMGLGLWMSPVEFHTSSETYARHPRWACTPTGHVTAQVPDDAGLGVWDVTNLKFQDYLIGVVDRLVAAYAVREFKFDFQAWVDCPPHDYADYEAAFVAVVHRMQERHPTVTFELDETNDQRSWPFESAAIGPSWFDNGHLHGSGRVEKLLHDVWSAAPWIPTWSMGVGTYDGTLESPYAGASGVDFLFPLAMLTHITFWTDLTKLSPEQRDATAWWIKWFKQHRNELGPIVYPLTAADPIDGTSWAAWQPWTGTSGYVFAFRQSGGPNTQVLHIRGVDPNRTYSVTDVRHGTSLGAFTGAQLAHGLPVELAPHSAAVLSIH